MFTNLNLNEPDFLIKCNALIYSNQVYHQMRDNGVQRAYVYAVAIDDPVEKFKYQIIKIGRSSPDPGDGEIDVGERIARQLCHVPGWQYYTGLDPISSHGQDFMNAVNYRIKSGHLPMNFNKDMITVGIWDITKRMPQVLEIALTNEYLASSYAEAELTYQYKQENLDNLPILNFTDPSKAKAYKGYISKSVGQLFGWT